MGVWRLFYFPKHLMKIPTFTHHQPLSGLGQAVSDVTSPVKLVKRISPGCHALCSKASFAHSDSANCLGDEAA